MTEHTHTTSSKVLRISLHMLIVNNVLISNDLEDTI